LNRALEGLHRLQQQGEFTVPKVVQEALAVYQRDNNTAAAFIEECLVEDKLSSVVKQWLYRTYVTWCQRQGFKKYMNQRDFKKSLEQAFPSLDEYRDPGGKGPRKWKGIKLTEDAPSPDEDHGPPLDDEEL
jgi:putative DNA primase/helicase